MISSYALPLSCLFAANGTDIIDSRDNARQEIEDELERELEFAIEDQLSVAEGVRHEIGAASTTNPLPQIIINHFDTNYNKSFRITMLRDSVFAARPRALQPSTREDFVEGMIVFNDLRRWIRQAIPDEQKLDNHK